LRISESGKKKVLNKKEKIEAEPHYGCILLPPERAAVNTRVKDTIFIPLGNQK